MVGGLNRREKTEEGSEGGEWNHVQPVFISWSSRADHVHFKYSKRMHSLLNTKPSQSQ